MSPAVFQAQTQRLINRFGNKAFDKEFVNLVWRAAGDMSDAGFVNFVDVMIGSRPHTKPPLLAEFREARLNEEKNKLKSDIVAAAGVLQKKLPEDAKKHLRAILSKEFDCVTGPLEAMEVAKIRLRTKSN